MTGTKADLAGAAVILPVFRMGEINRILRDPDADPDATARALLWIPNLLQDIPAGTVLTPPFERMDLARRTE